MLAVRHVNVMIERREIQVVVNGTEGEHEVTAIDVRDGEIIIYLSRIEPKAELPKV